MISFTYIISVSCSLSQAGCFCKGYSTLRSRPSSVNHLLLRLRGCEFGLPTVSEVFPLEIRGPGDSSLLRHWPQGLLQRLHWCFCVLISPGTVNVSMDITCAALMAAAGLVESSSVSCRAEVAGEYASRSQL